LTLEHVYQRLNIKACGENVMALVNAASVVKTEPTDDGDELPEVKHGSQPSTGSWYIGVLISLNLPNAVVELEDDMLGSTVVDVDDLRPVSKVKESAPARLHPTLQVGGTAMNTYDYDYSQMPFFTSMVYHICMQTHLAGQGCVERMVVWRLSDEGKIPIVLQLRAKEPFKKGTLHLAPAFGDVIAADGKALSKGVIDDSMLQAVSVMVHSGVADKRRKCDTGKTVDFRIRSPLMAGKTTTSRTTCLENLAPFWAVLRCGGPKSVHNMELHTAVLGNHKFEHAGKSYRQSR
jgi:hypothetical protein